SQMEKELIIETKKIHNEENIFKDFINKYVSKAKEAKVSIDSSENVIKLNSHYKNNLTKKKEDLTKDINLLINDITTEIEEQVEDNKDSIVLDSICLYERGFIGNKVFGRDKCKEWKVTELKLKRK
ncbi:MAG: hypothetical protein KC414_13970, partial [Romboutsia sp.]|nr:hypothetical protein [Romboutsia sp.]